MSPTAGEPTTGLNRRTVVLVVLSVVAVARHARSTRRGVFRPQSHTRPAPGGQPTAAPGSVSASVTQITPATSPGTPGAPAATPFRYQPLWPFTNEAEAAVWQQGYRSGGHPPWPSGR
jgi:hypothetical protein